MQVSVDAWTVHNIRVDQKPHWGCLKNLTNPSCRCTTVPRTTTAVRKRHAHVRRHTKAPNPRTWEANERTHKPLPTKFSHAQAFNNHAHRCTANICETLALGRHTNRRPPQHEAHREEEDGEWDSTKGNWGGGPRGPRSSEHTRGKLRHISACASKCTSHHDHHKSASSPTSQSKHTRTCRVQRTQQDYQHQHRRG